jgi:hypothetical protein
MPIQHPELDEEALKQPEPHKLVGWDGLAAARGSPHWSNIGLPHRQ